MPSSFDILAQNGDFLLQAYNLEGWIGVLMALSVVDLGLKGWAMWRAAKLDRRGWYVALLIVNSLGILPALFLIMTNAEYVRGAAKTGVAVPSAAVRTTDNATTPKRKSKPQQRS